MLLFLLEFAKSVFCFIYIHKKCDLYIKLNLTY